MVTHLYCMCLNEEAMIPYFLGHYLPIVDKIHVFDNGSTDASLNLLKGDPRIAVESLKTIGDSFMDTYNNLMNTAWMRSRGEAEWIITAEMDEHLHHPDLRGYLARSRYTGVTFVTALGYNMITERFPTDPRPLWQQIVRGVRETAYDKPAIFDPQAITAINYYNGRHAASPTGHVVHEPQRQVKLLHYKSLGLDYVCSRNLSLSAGLQAEDIDAQYGAHYLRTRNQTEADLKALQAYARRVPGLHATDDNDEELSFMDERDRIAGSGLFDAVYYVDQNPDVATSSIDPLTHYCAFGWREARRPNPCFDSAWYLATYDREILDRGNPLLDYIMRGEKRGRFPSVDFDPELYRVEERLSLDVSPLWHYLAGRRNEPARGWSRHFSRLIGLWDRSA
jgi:hypothetical protein